MISEANTGIMQNWDISQKNLSYSSQPGKHLRLILMVLSKKSSFLMLDINEANFRTFKECPH